MVANMHTCKLVGLLPTRYMYSNRILSYRFVHSTSEAGVLKPVQEYSNKPGQPKSVRESLWLELRERA